MKVYRPFDEHYYDELCPCQDCEEIREEEEWFESLDGD